LYYDKKRKKFSEQFQKVKEVFVRDYPIIIAAFTFAIILHIYVKHEKSQKVPPPSKELKHVR
jgi:hypothetical protein